MKQRVGIFFFLVGLTMAGLFLLSDVADNPSFNLLVIGVALLGFGLILMLSSPKKPPEDPDRFHSVRSLGKKKK